ncbi:hypothetical protein [Streptomyces sp. NPDC005209]|uniref:hypothetical protein n=1 Tax=Streptomyces sp. NPDC005209 TaxID=3156715 RepID=UPI0033AC9F8B
MTLGSCALGLRKKMAITAGVAAMIATSAVVLAEPASASTECSSGYHCVFWNGYDSAKHSYYNSDADFTNDTFNQSGRNGSTSLSTSMCFLVLVLEAPPASGSAE